jgi:hypothetical protein
LLGYSIVLWLSDDTVAVGTLVAVNGNIFSKSNLMELFGVDRASDARIIRNI